MKDAENTYLARELPARYELITIYGQKITMDGLFREEITIDEKEGLTYYIWTPIIPDDWLVWMQGKYIDHIVRVPVACSNIGGISLYKPVSKIYQPEFEIKKLSSEVYCIKIYGGSLWDKRKR